MGSQKQGDKTPDPISSEQAQKGGRADVEDRSLERPDPQTETVDKVITPTSIKDQQRQTDEIKRQSAENERKLHE